MGKVACQIIITEGELALGVTELYRERNPDINTIFLSKAIEASCEGIHQASLYLEIEEEGDKITEEFTQPIIDLHMLITTKLSTEKVRQSEITHIAKRLFMATRQLYRLYGEMPKGLTDLVNLFHKLELD